MTKIQTLKHSGITEWLKNQPEKKALRSALRELHRLIKGQQQRRHDLTWWYDVGICVAQILPKGNRRKGDNVIELLANDLQPERDLKDWTLPNLLYRARDFVAKFKSRKAVAALARRTNSDNQPLTHLHVSVLLTVKDDAQRDEFLERCLEESWSGQELRRQIQNAMGRKRGTGGRAPRPPKYSSAGVALRDIKVMANRWTAFHKVWYIGLRRLPMTDQNETMLQEINSAKQGLESVRDDVKEALERVGAIERLVKSKLSAGSSSRRAKSKKPA
jgi:hypothetical protein